MGFIIILILTTVAIAGCAAFFSIYGLAAIFSGIFWPVVVMGTSLEAGKLVAASYVYRFRDCITTTMKIYLISAILVLMLITSAGIFGFLSMGYQQDTLPLKQQEQQIKLLTSEKTELEAFKKERLDRRKQIDTDITSLPNNYITSRQRLLKSYGPELDRLQADIRLYTKQISDKTLKISKLKQEKLVSEVHTGPIIFIAKAFSSDTDDATKWMIILIMFAFDPLAVALTLAINQAMSQRKKELANTKKSVEIVQPKPTETVVKTVSVEELDEPEIEPIKTAPVDEKDEHLNDEPEADEIDTNDEAMASANISIEDSKAVLKPEQRKKLIRQAKIYVKENQNPK